MQEEGPDRDERARRIAEEWDGIFPAYEAFYIHSILYAADRCLEAFERYGERHESDAAGYEQVSAVHEALGHAAALSRFFWPSGAGPRTSESIRRLKNTRAEKLRAAFELTDASPLRDRSLRDALEHFDERLDNYLLTSDAGQYYPLPRIGDSEGLPDETRHIFKLVDPEREVFVVLGRRFEFSEIWAEVARVLLEARRMSAKGDRLKRRGQDD